MLEKHGQKYIRYYIAGFFDGEGCITTFIPKNSHDRYRCLITITNTSIPCLELIQTYYGGKIYDHGGVNKPCSVLHLNMLETLYFLYDITDLLIDKKEQAEYAIELLNYATTNYGRWDKEVVKYYVNKIQELKR